jgi:hypothetical protein
MAGGKAKVRREGWGQEERLGAGIPREEESKISTLKG